jgi:histone acetyltransferase SAS3
MGLVSYRNYWRLILCKYLIEHVPENKTQKSGTSIKQISDDTGMTPDDVISALEALRFLVRDPVTHVYAFRVDLRYCHKELEKWEAKNHVKLNSRALTWTPYVMGRGNTSNFELGPALNTIAPREDEEETKPVEAIAVSAVAIEDFVSDNSLAQKQPVEGGPAVLESTEPNDNITTEALANEKTNGIDKENGSLHPSEQGDVQVPGDSIIGTNDDEDAWQRPYENIPVSRFQVFPPISKRPGMSRAGSSLARPVTMPRASSTIRTPAQARPRPRARRSTGGTSVRKSAPKKSTTAKRKTGGTGRGPGRWPKGTKKSDYGNADSGPGLPPSWLEKQKAKPGTIAGNDAEEEVEMHDTVQVQVHETKGKKGKQVETISARFEVMDYAHPERTNQSSASSTNGAKTNGLDGPTDGEDSVMNQPEEYDDADAPGEEE